MTATAPEWLAQHDGALKAGVTAGAWLVLFNGSPQYRLVVAPAKGRFTCQVVQTINGKRLDKGADFPDGDAALQGGLEELRAVLGW